jgi:hypothetical protein
MISFLNPLFWLGIVAVGAPLWLHLRRKDREKVVHFAALRFLEDQPVVKQPPLSLKNLPLFLLRLMAVLLLIAAFARPYFQQSAALTTSSIVYVFDNTLSRQAGGGWEHDRDYLLGQIRQASSREQIAVVELASQPRVVVNFGDSPAQAEEKVRALQPTTERGTMLSALRQATFMLKQSLGEKKQIVVLSDNQKNQWEENSSAPPFLAPGLVTFPFYSDVETRPNFYVADPKVQCVFLGDRAFVQFTATIGRTGDVKSAVVSLTANDREILHRSLDLDAKTDKVGIVTQWETDPKAWLQGSISVTAQPDDLPQDNAAYFSVPPITEGKVALLTQSLYLHAALSSPVSRGHWNVEDLQPAHLQDTLNAPPASDADILMIDGNYLQSEQARQLVRRYFQSGRGVFIMVGELTTLLTGFLEELSFDPETRLAPNALAPLAPIRYFSPTSPIFKPFTMPDFSNLLEVRMGETIHLAAREAKPILFSQSGDPLLFDGTKDTGRYLLSTFLFDRRQTDWVIHPSFVPFLDSALQYLRPQSTLNASLEPGEVWLVQIPASHDVKKVILSAGGKEIQRTDVDADHRALIRTPDEPGLYTLSYDQDPAVQQVLAVNPPAKESELTYLQAEPEIIKAWTLSKPEDGNKANAAEALATTRAASENLWWLLVLAGFTALFLEMIVLARRGHA